MHVTRISIGRLFNTGSYEHVRYELTAEVQANESAAAALVGLERILDGLSPKRTVKTWREIAREEAQLLQERAMTDEAFNRIHPPGCYIGTREEFQKRREASVVEDKLELDQWEKRHAKARRLLDNLGGASKWTDAKLEWEHCDEHDEP